MKSALCFQLVPMTTSFLPYHLPINLRLPSLRRSSFDEQQGIRKTIIRSCYGSEEIGPLDGFQFTPTKIFMEEDFLNDRLQEGFLKRIRYAMKPDEAYALIFSWDNVVVGTQALKLSAWKELAHEANK
ncbi:uncharacterized protein [Rutidosis leptorrhynchoides]|uniref:uncharacterized protein n=1 Tax=Rutidosis leptorrhynchoides TaxID=125765 RepID=UPI003A98E88A